MATIPEVLKNNRRKILTLALVLALVVLAGFAAYQIFSPINPELEAQLKQQILGQKISFDQNVIARVEKRQDYGRSIELSYINSNRLAFEELCKQNPDCIPTSFFDYCRLTPLYGMSSSQRDKIGC